MEQTKAIPRKNDLEEISGLMTFDELPVSLHELTWYKAGGDNGVLPSFLKALNTNNRHKLLKFILLWLSDENFKCPEWLKSLLKVLPKKGDLLNSNCWKSIVLIAVVLKFVCIFINTRLQKLLKWHGIACQFGATPNIGCQDAAFAIKLFFRNTEKNS